MNVLPESLDLVVVFQPLLAAAAHAWKSGLEFPYVDFKKITNSPPQDFMVFPSHGHNCPTVVWITLSNRKFKSLQNYVPRSTAEPPSKLNEMFC